MRLKTTTEFIEQACIVHGDLYNYSQVEYKSSLAEVIIVCKLHGCFEQTPKHHLLGCGCQKCSIIRTGEKRNRTTQSFVEEACRIHGSFYDYSASLYTKRREFVKIICPEHGIFETIAAYHLTGGGCPTCIKIEIAKERIKSTKKFVEESLAIHKGLFSYEEVEYTGARRKVKITCQKHGIFLQEPLNHLHGHGCPTCSHSISIKETEWLDYVGVDARQHSIRLYDQKSFSCDGFDPETNIVYLFHGDFWHGNPKCYDPEMINCRTGTTMKSLFQKTLEMDEKIKKSGFTLITIWENEWDAIKKFIKRKKAI